MDSASYSGDTRNLYEVLQIPRNASQEQIKEAYRDLVAVFHPDKYQGNERLRLKTERELLRINEAYDTLRDKNKRANYDYELLSEPRRASERTQQPSGGTSSSDAKPPQSAGSAGSEEKDKEETPPKASETRESQPEEPRAKPFRSTRDGFLRSRLARQPTVLMALGVLVISGTVAGIWRQIRSDDSAQNVKPNLPASPAVSAAPVVPKLSPLTLTGRVGVVVDDFAILRKQADASAPPLSKVPKGTNLALIYEAGSYYGVTMIDSSVGWVAKKSVKLIDYQVQIPPPPGSEFAQTAAGTTANALDEAAVKQRDAGLSHVAVTSSQAATDILPNRKSSSPPGADFRSSAYYEESEAQSESSDKHLAASDRSADSRQACADRLRSLGVDVNWHAHGLSELLNWEACAQTASRLRGLGLDWDWREHELDEMLDIEARLNTAARLKSLGEDVDWHEHSLGELLDRESRISTANRIRSQGRAVNWREHSLAELLEMESTGRNTPARLQ